MKFFTPLVLALFITASLFAQDTLSNPGFENWTNHGTYMDPDGWTTLNPLTGSIGAVTCAQSSSDKHSGSYAVKLTTKSLGSTFIPAILTNGTIDVASQNVVGGKPISSRPLALTGWYKYSPVGADTALFEIDLYSGLTKIGGGQLFVTTSGWASFSIPITYTSGSTPDTSRIVFNSSAVDTPHVNSTLLLDDLDYSYNSGIAESSYQSFSVYPNPANDLVTLDNRDMHAVTAQLFSVDGKLEKSVTLTEEINTLNIAGMQKGFYVIRAVGRNGITYRSGFVIQ